MSKPPFRVDEIGEIVLVHGFEEIHCHFEGCERELPALRGAVREQVERGRRGFVFDLRSAEPIAAYPVVKWGAMYGAVASLNRRLVAGEDPPGESGRRAAGMVKLVVAEVQRPELEIYKMTEIFEHFAGLDEAFQALRSG